MKAKIIFPIILSAMLLTACNSGNRSADNISAETEQTETTSQTVTAASKTETEAHETTAVTTSETIEETTTTAAETLPPKIEYISGDVELDINKIDISGILNNGENFLGGIRFFKNNIAAMMCRRINYIELRFFDINDLTVKASVTEPDGWKFNSSYCPCVNDGGDVLCKIPLSRFDNEKLKNDYAVILVYDDFTTEFIEGEPREILSFPAGSHNIADYSFDLLDADSGEIIVEGFEDAETGSGFGNMSLWYDYNFQIDNDRFVYRTCGIERMPGFGYYDFTTGKAADFPNSRDFMPIGYHNGKIYAEETCWDGMCQGELYTFDIDTLESEQFISSPVTIELNDYTEYSMPPSGKYIAANYYDRDNEIFENSKNTIFIISPDSGEVLAKCEFNSSSIDYDVVFINDNCFAAQNGDSEIIIFNVKM